jgi:hypothetical protein
MENISPSGVISGSWRANRGRPSFYQRLTYFQLDRPWTTALEEATTMATL